MTYEIVHNLRERSFTTEVDGLRSIVEYHQMGDLLTITHTLVPSQLEGRGIAAALTQAVVDYGVASGLTVRPKCSYAVAYFKRHGLPLG